jgi:hypothetical protein
MKAKASMGCVAAGLAAAFVFTSAAQGFVLDAGTDAQKHRRDIGKQLAKYVFCLGKVGINCEKKGAHTGTECNLADGSTAPTIDPGTAGKFSAGLASCDGKFVAEKKQKTSDYQQIGCPGDCDEGAAGIQQCADLGDYDDNVTDGANAGGAKTQVTVLGGLIGANCVTHLGLPAGTSADEVAIKCALNDAKRLSKYAKGVNKCVELCENDYKDKKGNGGPTDDPVCDVTAPGGAFADCLAKKADKALEKVIAPGNSGFVVGLIDTALNDAAQDLYNKDDPTTDPDVNVCGTCGDNVREGSEECDGGDDDACAGSCNANCTCP